MKASLSFALIFVFFSLASAQSGYQIAYNVLTNSEKDDYDVFMMNMDGSGKQNITNKPDVAWTYYAYKDLVYFISDRNACKRCYYLYSMSCLSPIT